MGKYILLTFVMCVLVTSVRSQYYNRYWHSTSKESSVAVKSNLLYNLTTTLNLGVEVKVDDDFTLEMVAGYNPWTFPDNKKIRQYFFQPEVRYWITESFDGHFIGFNGIYSHFNIANIKLPFKLLPDLQTNRYQGNLASLGISYGYQWQVGSKWNIEASIGVGWVYTAYDKFEGVSCGKPIENHDSFYIGPTKIGISILYFLK